LHEDLDRGADLQLADVDELVGGNEAFGFAANIDDDFVLANFGDDARNDRTLLQLVEGGLLQQLLHDLTNMTEARESPSAPELRSTGWWPAAKRQAVG
jgi:hypothetical protein